MRLTESQIRKIVRNEVRKGKSLKEGASMGALDALNSALMAFMDAGGSTDELLDNAQGFIDDWTHGDEAERFDDQGGPFTSNF